MEALKDSAQFRVQMAEIGHPVLGPQSYWKLTFPEVRVYAEGMYQKSERQQEDVAYAEGGDSQYNDESKRKRDEQALQRVEQKVQQQQS